SSGSSGCGGPPAAAAVGYDQLSSTLSSLQISYGLPSASLKSQPISYDQEHATL
ncbi:hypothetical protein Tco_0275178, partial [Tanacetum coccineum]